MSCLLYKSSLTACRRNWLQNKGLIGNLQIAASFSSKDKADSKKGLAPVNLLRDKDITTDQSEKGFIYDKRPLKVPLEAGKKYAWCACGKSKSQPFCDGTHKNEQLKISLKPVILMVEESKEYYLCNCKQTANRPFCDGTHKRQDIQDAVRH